MIKKFTHINLLRYEMFWNYKGEKDVLELCGIKLSGMNYSYRFQDVNGFHQNKMTSTAFTKNRSLFNADSVASQLELS